MKSGIDSTRRLAPLLALLAFVAPAASQEAARDANLGAATSTGSRAQEIISSRLPLVTAQTEDSARLEALVELWESTRLEAEKTADIAERRQLLAACRSRLRMQLVRAFGKDGKDGGAGDLLEQAVAQVNSSRELSLQKRILCNCPKEDWTRTLAVCWEPCRNGQVASIRNWVRDGLSNDEVIQKMVDQDGHRVIARPRSMASKLTPYFLGVGGVVIVAFFLRAALRRGRTVPVAGARATSAEDADASRDNVRGDVTVGDVPEDAGGESTEDGSRSSEDAELDARLEEELRRLDD